MVAVNPYLEQEDDGGAVIAVTYVFIVITLLFTALRITLGVLRKRAFGVDDVLLLVAVPLAILSSICTGNAVVNGLGRSIAFIHSGQLSNYFKLSYAAQFCTLLAMAASKHSVVALIQRITPYNSRLQPYIRSMHLVVGSWLLFSIFGVAFQCSLAAPWIYQPSVCTGHGAIWYPVIVFSILTDIVLAFGYLPAFREIPVDSKKKTFITSVFLSRLIVPILSIVYIAMLVPALSSEDQTSDMTIPTIMAQVTMDFSIITAAALAISRAICSLEHTSPSAVVSEITAVPLDPSHSRTTSDENNRLRDWAFANLRSSPAATSFTKDISLESTSTINKPEPAQISLARVDSAPPVPPRSLARSASPRLTLNFDTASRSDVKEAWFVNSNRSSAMTDLSTLGAKRASTRNDIAC